MFERFTTDARLIVVNSQVHARRLGHNYIGCEHLLLSLATLDGEVGETLRGAGATPQAVDAAIQRMVGPQWFHGVDREALAAIGVDLDVVRERVEAQFGRPAAPCRRRPWLRRRRRNCEPGAGYIQFTPRAKKCLELSLREALALRHKHIGPEHILLGLTGVKDSVAAAILAELGVSTDALRTETLNRHRKAG